VRKQADRERTDSRDDVRLCRLTNARLTEQGVISLKELWGTTHYPEGKASEHRLPR